jgi:hypothetical protein
MTAMTPDEEHAKYFNEYPIGDKMTVFLEAQRFINEQKEFNKTFVTVTWFNEKIDDLTSSINNVEGSIKEIFGELKIKINTEQFYWIIGILMMIVVGLFGVIYAKMEKIDESQNITKNSVSQIQGLLQGADITK